jgi:asparagine synthase (glutamine-hydrolysing)
MSRLVGLISEKSKDCEAMLNAVKTSNSWQNFTVKQKDCCFGSVSNNTNVFSYPEGLLIGTDGFIYNQKDLCGKKLFEEWLRDSFHSRGFADSISLLNGDFSISIFDAKEKTLWLARDRVGVKPLYYFSKNNDFAFASRIKSLLVKDNISKEPNKNFVARFAGTHYRYFDNFPNESPFKEIKQLPAGNILCFNQSGIRISPYWSLTPLDQTNKTPESLAEEYSSLLQDAVKDRVSIAKNPAFTLSGGMDSSSVLASSVKILNQKQHAFSTVYVDKTYDESSEIESMLDTCVSEWHRVELDDSPPVFDIVSKMIEVNDEPIATATWLSHYILCEEVSKAGFKSIFGGLGGDELNAGEYEYFFFHFADLIKQGQEDKFKTEVSFWQQYHDHPIYKKDLNVARDGISRFVDLDKSGVCLPDSKRMAKYFNTINRDYLDLTNFIPNMVAPFESYLKNRTFQDIFYETAPCCLRAEDRQSMAFGLDNFVPFFDYRLIEFMFGVPGELKIKDGVTKVLLRSAMKGILPEETRDRIKKTGWNAPAHKWFSGKGLEQLRDLVNSKSFQTRGIYNNIEVDRIITEHSKIVDQNEPTENHMMFLWQLVNLELWLESLQKTV